MFLKFLDKYLYDTKFSIGYLLFIIVVFIVDRDVFNHLGKVIKITRIRYR